MPRNRRAVMSTVLFTLIVFLTGTLLLFLGSAAQAGRPVPGRSLGGAKARTRLGELIASDAWTGS